MHASVVCVLLGLDVVLTRHVGRGVCTPTVDEQYNSVVHKVVLTTVHSPKCSSLVCLELSGWFILHFTW